MLIINGECLALISYSETCLEMTVGMGFPMEMEINDIIGNGNGKQPVWKWE